MAAGVVGQHGFGSVLSNGRVLQFAPNSLSVGKAYTFALRLVNSNAHASVASRTVLVQPSSLVLLVPPIALRPFALSVAAQLNHSAACANSPAPPLLQYSWSVVGPGYSQLGSPQSQLSISAYSLQVCDSFFAAVCVRCLLQCYRVC